MSDTDPNIAIFSDAAYSKEVSSTTPTEFRDTPAAPQAWRYPAHIITIRHFANDTPLTHSRIDWATKTLHLDWRAVFSSLLYEEKLRLALVDDWVRTSFLSRSATLFFLPTAPRLLASEARLTLVWQQAIAQHLVRPLTRVPIPLPLSLHIPLHPSPPPSPISSPFPPPTNPPPPLLRSTPSAAAGKPARARPPPWPARKR